MPAAFVVDHGHGQVPRRFPDADQFQVHEHDPPNTGPHGVVGIAVHHGRRHLEPRLPPLGDLVSRCALSSVDTLGQWSERLEGQRWGLALFE
ncbi:MAG: hypothetical protein ACRDR6_07525 [Pseudonocardiaceae bacterium]